MIFCIVIYNIYVYIVDDDCVGFLYCSCVEKCVSYFLKMDKNISKFVFVI